ncbi:MAG: hypothetical protein LBL93_04595 [Ruminococcus sp.]|jgi:hypothetical protein|nr:hypothetical protein [Ruminococcus sp.]
MKKIISILIIIVIFSSCSEKASPELTGNKPAENPENAVFEVVSYDEKGIELCKDNGVFLNSKGLAVTKYGVLEAAAYAKAFYNGFVCDIEGFYYGFSDCNIAIIKVSDKIEFPYLNVNGNFSDTDTADKNSDENSFAITNDIGELIGINGELDPTYAADFEEYIPNSVNLHPVSELRYDELVKPNEKYENYSYIPDFGAVMTKYTTDKGELDISTYAYYYKQVPYSELLKYCNILENNNLEKQGEYQQGFVYTYGMFYVSVFNNNEKNRTEIVISSNDEWVKENFTEKKTQTLTVPALNAKMLSNKRYLSFGLSRYEDISFQSNEMQNFLAGLDEAGFVRTQVSPNAIAFESGFEEKSVCIYFRNKSLFLYVTDLKPEVQRIINLDINNSHMNRQNDDSEILPP